MQAISAAPPLQLAFVREGAISVQARFHRFDQFLKSLRVLGSPVAEEVIRTLVRLNTIFLHFYHFLKFIHS